MLTIDKNTSWLTMERLFKSFDRRMNWFLFEFGKRMTGLVHEEVLGNLSKIQGTADYRKRLVVAEIRDKAARAWWAIVARSQSLGQGEHDSRTSLLTAVPRLNVAGGNPVAEILRDQGPWTVETIPYVPSQREAAIVIRPASEQEVNATRQRNTAQGEAIWALMQKHQIDFESRVAVYEKLRVVPDLEVEALRIEFGLAERSGAHWRPALSFAKRGAIKKLQSDKELIRAITDPKFKGFKTLQHIDERLTADEVKALEKFQKQMRRASK